MQTACWAGTPFVGAGFQFEQDANLEKFLESFDLENVTLVVGDRGMKDIAFREKELNHWIKHFPDAKIVRDADADHFLAEEKPEELIRELTEMLKL